jgi:hypothetical protein
MDGLDGCFLKPLLGVSKPTLQRYLQCKGLSWREDSSNQSRKYKRNAVRLDLLPLMAELAGGGGALSSRLEQLSAQSGDVREMVEMEVSLSVYGVMVSCALFSHEVCRMPYAVCCMLYAVCCMVFTVCLMPYVVCLMPYVLCRMPYALYLMPYTVRDMPCLSPTKRSCPGGELNWSTPIQTPHPSNMSWQSQRGCFAACLNLSYRSFCASGCWTEQERN